MEHTERITRRQLLGLSAVAAGSLLFLLSRMDLPNQKTAPLHRRTDQSVMQLYWTKMAI